MGKLIDLTGQRFGKLTVMKRADDKCDGKHRPIVTWECVCDCGNITNVTSQSLRTGSTKSCGCLQKERPDGYTANNFIDLTGEHFGRLTVISREGKNKRGNALWRCKCDCGNETIVLGARLRNGKTKSCGCLKEEFLKHHKNSKSKKKEIKKTTKIKIKKERKPQNSNFQAKYNDIIGKRFGRLIVIKYLEMEERIKKKECWLCKCDCGNYTTSSYSSLKNGSKKSCGCLALENSKRPRKHGMAKTRIWNIYQNMVRRCNNENEPAYKNYGGRGISVCDEWTGDDGMKRFFEWSFENGYRDDLEIDRINVDGNYEPSNCRWATSKQQNRNRRDNIQIEYKGKIQTLPDWCDELGLEYNMIYLRYKRGWDVERMFTQPKRII